MEYKSNILNLNKNANEVLFHTFTIRGGSRKKIAKKIIPKVPVNS
jgi:hypothetical protein